MTAVSGDLSGAAVSSTFTPTKDISEYKIRRNASPGDVFLESYNPETNEWNVETKGGSGAMFTPDPAITYRFRSTGVGADFTYYMGP